MYAHRRSVASRRNLPGVLAGALVILAGISQPGCSDDSSGTGGDEGDAGCAAPGPEIPDNEVDEDCDGWLDTSKGFRIRADHPRVIVDRATLEAALARMIGPEARKPYSDWFEALKESEDSGSPVDLASLALLYLGTGEATYLDRFVERIPTEGEPTFTELAGFDLLFDELPDETKTLLRDRVAADENVWYWHSTYQSIHGEAAWGYHSAVGVAKALMYAGIFALTPMELNKDAERHPFDCLNYLALVSEQLSEQGHFRLMENRIAGDPTYNDALPGSPGGMYDNFGYDSAEESWSVNVLAEWMFLTGQDLSAQFLHDRYRALFYQNMQYPHLFTRYEEDQWCHAAGTETHVEARIWNTQTDWVSYPRRDAIALTAWLYQDEKMQYYANHAFTRILCGPPYDGMYWDLLFYDDSLSESPPSDNPTAMYFNGPGLVAMRTDWSNEAAFAVFMAGEGISRRYEDANSFLIHRKVDVFPHGGARIRNNEDNHRHHWYHIRSIAKNTLKVFDPDECLDLDESNNRGPLHSGTRLVPSDNMGGQMFETQISTEDGVYVISSGGLPGRQSNPNHPLGLYETANIVKFEHAEGDYTYTVGDGAAAYTRKIDYFEREFLFLRPDTFIIFDRVRSAEPSYKKVWVVHTVDEPLVAGPPDETAQGMKAWRDATKILVHNPRNDTLIVSLLPQTNRVEVRGGDTVLASGLILNPSSPVGPGQVAELEIPRWLEVFAVGSDTEGTITITGDALEGAGVSEEVVFDGAEQKEVSGKPTESVTGDRLTDSGQSWPDGRWAGYMLRVHCANEVHEGVITDNDAHTLYGDFAPCDQSQAWLYEIYRPVANSYLHFTRVTGISTTDMDVDNLTISVPHYFDAEDALGRLHSFAPHTDGRDDQYRKRRDLGQYTLSIEETEPATETNFLNIVVLRDPGVAMPDPALVETDVVAGAVVEGRLVLFAKRPGALSEFVLPLDGSSPSRALLLDLEPDADYFVSLSNGVLSVARRDNGGTRCHTSGMGICSTEL